MIRTNYKYDRDEEFQLEGRETSLRGDRGNGGSTTQGEVNNQGQGNSEHHQNQGNSGGDDNGNCNSRDKDNTTNRR